MQLKSTAAADFSRVLQAQGFDFFSGVPCSIFNALYRELERSGRRYVPSVREDSAVGMAVGAYLAGRQPAVIMQNSGLGYSLNAFTSLASIYRIPLLVLISWRGYEGKDAPEHVIMGGSMLRILDDIGALWVVLGETDGTEDLRRAIEIMREKRVPVFLAVREGALT